MIRKSSVVISTQSGEGGLRESIVAETASPCECPAQGFQLTRSVALHSEMETNAESAIHVGAVD